MSEASSSRFQKQLVRKTQIQTESTGVRFQNLGFTCSANCTWEEKAVEASVKPDLKRFALRMASVHGIDLWSITDTGAAAQSVCINPGTTLSRLMMPPKAPEVAKWKTGDILHKGS